MNRFDNIIQELFPLMNDAALLAEINVIGKPMEIDAGTILIDYGSYAKFMPLVVTGVIKVMRTDKDGDELFLYYLNPGQSCAMTLNCCITQLPSEIRAVTEEKTSIISIPVDKVRDWMDRYRGWRDFILKMYSDRFLELLHTIDSIAFMNMDERLVAYLQEKAAITGSRSLLCTHQEIAYDLHTSREVISRLLKQLEKKGKITLLRNKIELL